MEVLVSEHLTEAIPEVKVEEKDCLIMSSKVVDILDVPINTALGRADSEELSLVHIVWD